MPEASNGGFEDYELPAIGQDQADFNPNAAGEGDENLHVRFFMHPHQDKAESLAQGRPIFQDKEYVEIMIPGDRTNIVNRPVRPHDKARFPKHYQAFKTGVEDIMVGTPLEMWPVMSRAMVEELRFFKILTVEQLASVPDSVAQRFMGINIFKQRAQDYVAAAAGNASTDQLRAELDASRNETETLKAALADLSETVSKMKQPTKSRAKKAAPEPEAETSTIDEADPDDR